MTGSIIIIVGAIVTLIILIFSKTRCPHCGGKLTDDTYDENINKVVWTCKKCGDKWILY